MEAGIETNTSNEESLANLPAQAGSQQGSVVVGPSASDGRLPAEAGTRSPEERGSAVYVKAFLEVKVNWPTRLVSYLSGKA
jgi:hypothetical protein